MCGADYVQRRPFVQDEIEVAAARANEAIVPVVKRNAVEAVPVFRLTTHSVFAAEQQAANASAWLHRLSHLWAPKLAPSQGQMWARHGCA